GSSTTGSDGGPSGSTGLPDGSPGDEPDVAPQPVCAPPTDVSGIVTPADTIIDFENDKGEITVTTTRRGSWYTFNDATVGASKTPAIGSFPPALVLAADAAVDPANTTRYAAHTLGHGFAVWGAGMGFDLNATGSAKSLYDASSYDGIMFLAKAGAG